MAPSQLKHQPCLPAFNENVDNHLTFQQTTLSGLPYGSPLSRRRTAIIQEVELFDNDKEGVCTKLFWFPWILPSRN